MQSSARAAVVGVLAVALVPAMAGRARAHHEAIFGPQSFLLVHLVR
jgi:hypothetical protein